MFLYLKIKPNQRFDRIELSGEQWIVRLKAPPVDGKANESLVKYLGEILDLSKSKITLKKGHTSTIKCLDIDADAEDVYRKLGIACWNLHNKM